MMTALASGRMSPLEYMLSVMNDSDADPARRDRMAVAAAPYVHIRGADAKLGKKEAAEQAALTTERIDLSGRVIVFESLKKRRTGIFRAVPVPPELLDALDLVHGIREAQRRCQAKALLWPWSRMTAFRWVQQVMRAAAIPEGPHACPKGCGTA